MIVGNSFSSKLVDTVLRASADFGIALDGDGDRLKLVDHWEGFTMVMSCCTPSPN